MSTAEGTLARLAWLIPAAAREGGVTLEEAARALAVTPERILADVATAADRDFYHPGGWVSDLVVLAYTDRLEVDRPGAFARPGKLNAREALCLSLGLRGLGAASFASTEARAALLERTDALVAGTVAKESAERTYALGDDEVDEGGSGIEATVIACARERRVCRIGYLSRESAGGARVTVDRDVEPYFMARSEGYWYALSWCRLRDGVRAFRLDRVISAEATDESFTVRDDFDADAWIEQRRVYRGRDETPTRIRYAPAVARWAREDAINRSLPVEDLDDGGVIVEHRVADWEWAVRHVLGYGADAEIVEPAEMRERVRAVVEGIPAQA